MGLFECVDVDQIQQPKSLYDGVFLSPLHMHIYVHAHNQSDCKQPKFYYGSSEKP